LEIEEAIMVTKEQLWEQQNQAMRHPSTLFGGGHEASGIHANSLQYSLEKGFTRALHEEEITLLVSREYEHLLLAIRPYGRSYIEQSFLHLPHPSGIAVDRRDNSIYVAATRNPNQIVQLNVSQGNMRRKLISNSLENIIIPSRVKYYPGEYYFHDLVHTGEALLATSVGMNSVISVDMNSAQPEEPIWWPACVDKNGKPNNTANYIQLNSIAWGGSMANSYFSASGAKIGALRPGHPDYPVDGTGVIFEGATGKVYGKGLTRPHGARIHKGKVWVANSGYGTVGYIENGKYQPVFTLNGWTRGLCFTEHYLFVGVSRVLSRFRQYAPGIKTDEQQCAVVAIDMRSGKIAGAMDFPFGNQIFTIDYIQGVPKARLPFLSIEEKEEDKKIFSVSMV